MASVIPLARYRSITRRDLPLNVRTGDSDLRIAIAILWVGSAVRSGLALAHHQPFGVEASLALLCALLLPLYVFRTRKAQDTGRQ